MSDTTFVPEQLKRDNWQFYVLSRSNAPDVMVPNTRKFASSLFQSEKISGNTTRHNDIMKAIMKANDAWYEYMEEKDVGYAVKLCEEALDAISDMAYNPFWSIAQRDAFVGDKRVTPPQVIK